MQRNTMQTLHKHFAAVTEKETHEETSTVKISTWDIGYNFFSSEHSLN